MLKLVRMVWLNYLLTFTGKIKTKLETASAVRSVAWSYDAQKLLYTTDRTMGQTCELRLYDVNSIEQQGSPDTLKYP